MLSLLLRDLRHAWRLLRRQPAFTGVAILTLALGIGTTTAVFTIVNGVLLRPLPYRDPSRLVTLFYGHQGRRLAMVLSTECSRLRRPERRVCRAPPPWRPSPST